MTARRFFRIVVYLVLAFCVVAGVAFAAAKYWVLPSIHLWKEPITRVLSQAVGAPVEIGHIQARWRGLGPELELEDVAVSNSQGHEVLSIPHAVGQLKLSSFWARSPHFSHLNVTGLALLVSRDESGEIDFFSQPTTEEDIDPPAQVVDLKAGVYRWLSQQGRLQISESHVVWQDLASEQPPLALQVESLSLKQQYGQLQINGVLSSLRQAHTQLRFSSEWQLPDEKIHTEQPPTLAQGQIRVQVNHLQPSAWRRWVDMPSFLYQGTLNGQFLFDIKDEELTHAEGSVAIDRPFWADGRQLLSIEPQPFFQARAANFHFEFNQQALAFLAELSAEGPVPLSIPGAHWRAQLHDLNVHVPDEFTEPLFFKQVNLDAYSEAQQTNSKQSDIALDSSSLLSMDSAGVDAATDGQWQIKQLRIDTGVGVLQLEGALQLHAEDLWLSKVDLEGAGEHITLASIYKYFPNSLDPDLREWLQEGLTAGQIEQLRFQWQGLLDDFEYYQARETGHFQLEAQFENTTIDYYPATAQEAGWPALTGLDGWLYWENDDMRIEVENEPSLRLSADHAALIHHISAQIVDLYEQADLTLNAQGQATADDFFLLWSHSNLGELLKDTVDVQKISGPDWLLDLLLEVPLGVPEEQMEELTRVQGKVHVKEPAVVELWPEFAPLTQVQGSFGFSENGVHEVDVHAYWLGGPFAMHGSLGTPEDEMQVEAHPHTADLQAFYEHPALSVLEGDFAVDAMLTLDESEHLKIAARSNLQGLSIDLPAPLQKTKTDKSWPIQLDWLFLDDDGDRNQLYLALEERLYGQAVLDFAQHRVESAGLFSALTAENRLPLEPEQLNMDLQYSFLDVDAWWDWLEHIDSVDEPAWQWPERSQVRLQADEVYALGFGLELFTYTHQLLEPEQWRADISSDQIAGTVFWHQQASNGHPFGHVKAHFHRFDVLADFVPKIGVQPPKGGRVITKGDLSQTSTPGEKTSPVSKMPAVEPAHSPLLPQLPSVSLKVDEFNVGGYKLGTLAVEASGMAEGLGWTIDSFEMSVDQVMHTQGSGHWAIWGAESGLSLQWESNFENLGSYADYLGLAGYVEGGQGLMTAEFDWPYLPWRSNLDDLQGQVVLDLENGRLQPIQSRSAKLLEFLSLQSLSRIARLDLDVGSVLKEGFPFHMIEGEVQFERGWVHTDDYKVVSPVGSLFFEGRTHLQSHQIDAQALVIPELDVSGAALAAGIAVNPIVGMGALLAQWILKHPLSKAMTIRYQITGDWDDFSVEEIATGTSEEQAEAIQESILPLRIAPLDEQIQAPKPKEIDAADQTDERKKSPTGSLRVRSKTKLETTHPRASTNTDDASGSAKEKDESGD
ncbi:MAG TPA: AsmA-like C-terminal region-containing protein [Paenalcaligenes sp.]|nr:AsmA-like C-terminal region-containing protein [Paenalcaligenes sp.]